MAVTGATALVLGAVFVVVLTHEPDGGGATMSRTLTTDAAPPVDAGLHGDEEPPPVSLDAATQARLDAELADARAAAAQYPTAGAAQSAGFYRGVPYESGVGTHWVRFEAIDTRLDPAEPEMLLFASDADEAPLVGLTYYVYDSIKEPEGFTGDNDHWHRHLSVCVGRRAVYTDPGDAALNGCGPARARSGWMLHVWVAPGYDNPRGVFATRNPALP